MNTIRIVEFNVLAPVWVHERLYPQCSDKFFDQERLKHKIDYIMTNLPNADIYALTETQVDENNYLANALSAYDYYPAYHDEDYWMEWRNPNIEFKPNGVSIAINPHIFEAITVEAVPLSNKGNRCIIAKCIHRESQQLYRISVIHLNTNEDKFDEVDSLVSHLEDDEYIDIIVGDFNSNIRSINALRSAGFTDTFKTLHIEGSTIALTHNKSLGSIDHIIYRDAYSRITPVDGAIHSLNVWMLDKSYENRLCETVQNNGSDHFAIECQFQI